MQALQPISSPLVGVPRRAAPPKFLTIKDFLMKIACPQCGFERDVPEDRLPGSSAIATCPRCRHRFRISRDGIVEDMPEPTPTPSSMPPSSDGDDPLPPGAIIPGASSDAGQPETPAGESIARDAPETPQDTASLHGSSLRKNNAEHDSEEAAYRKNAAEAYERQAAEHEDVPFALDNPWEHPERDGYPAAFYQTAMRVMFAASRFFAGLQADAPKTKALQFYLIICVFQILVEHFWAGVFSGLLAPDASTDTQLQQFLRALLPLGDLSLSSLSLALLLGIALRTMGLVLSAALYHLAFRISAPDRAEYPLIFQVLAYSTAPALLCIVPVAGGMAGAVWSIACSLIGCRYALRLSWGRVVGTLASLYMILVLTAMLIIKVATAFTSQM